jgi:uncharacterized membrane protein YqaE (UPF0057 family)
MGNRPARSGCLTVALPPMAVYLRCGFSFHFGMNLVLTLLGYIPGFLHARYVCRPQAERGAERGSTTTG